jgi:alpha-galactosidase
VELCGPTTAEIVIDFYRTIRGAAGKSVLIGCNTFGHLAAGLVEMQRIGDDTSGRDWNRTRRMGVNSLAFRMPQHETFFANDGDCVGLTRQVSWDLNKQWLDLLARSGTPLFVSADPEVLGAAQRQAIQAAFARAARAQPGGEPLDWMDTTLPTRWRFGRETVAYRWSGESGPSPFAG